MKKATKDKKGDRSMKKKTYSTEYIEKLSKIRKGKYLKYNSVDELIKATS
jgi:hypothetical protein